MHPRRNLAVIVAIAGLLGAGALIGLFVLLGVFGFRAALRAPDLFGTLLAAVAVTAFARSAAKPGDRPEGRG